MQILPPPQKIEQLWTQEFRAAGPSLGGLLGKCTNHGANDEPTRQLRRGLPILMLHARLNLVRKADKFKRDGSLGRLAGTWILTDREAKLKPVNLLPYISFSGFIKLVFGVLAIHVGPLTSPTKAAWSGWTPLSLCIYISIQLGALSLESVVVTRVDGWMDGCLQRARCVAGAANWSESLVQWSKLISRLENIWTFFHSTQ